MWPIDSGDSTPFGRKQDSLMKRTIAVKSLLVVFAVSCTSQAALISYWNFNGLSIATASAPGSGGVPTSIAADQGSGSLSLTGWGGNVDDFGGDAINALGVDPAGVSLSLVSSAGNGTFIQTGPFSTIGLQDVIVTFATRGTSTGFNTGTWSYSTDNSMYTAAPGNTATTSTSYTLATMDLSAISAIENQPGVYLRYTLSGATNTGGNNRIDNLQINATETPEPSVAALAYLAGLAFVGLLPRRAR
jgi:hypothetical protein